MRVDGVPLQGFPVVRRINPAEAIARRVVLPHAGSPTSYNILSQLNVDNGCVIQTDTPISIQFNNQNISATPVPIYMNAGGVIVILDCVIGPGANYNILVTNVQPVADATLTTLEVGP